LKRCTKRINNYLSAKFITIGWIKPGAVADNVLESLTVGLMNLKKHYMIIISTGANDVYRNNPNEALMKIVKFIQNNTNTKILGISHRHDLVEYSCVNSAIQTFMYKLKKIPTHLITLLFFILLGRGLCSFCRLNSGPQSPIFLDLCFL
jgi:hypothetical protein